MQPQSPFAPAPDAFTRLLTRQEPDPGALWQEAEPLVDKAKGVLVLDDSTRDKPYAQRIELVTNHWSGKHRQTVRGINLITLLWTDGDRKIPCDYRLDSTADGRTKNDHFGEMMLMAKARGFAPRCVLFDGWYASLEDLKPIRDFGWRFLTWLKGNRKVPPGDGLKRALDAVAVSAEGAVPHLQGYGMVRAFRIDAPDGDTESWATNDLGREARMRRHYAELGFAIENDHRGLKQDCGVEGCQARSERVQRNHIGMAVRAFLRLEWHFFTTGVSGFMVKSGIVSEAIRRYIADPFVKLPGLSTA